MVLRYLCSFLVLILLGCGQKQEAQWRIHSGEIFGSTFLIKYYHQKSLEPQIDGIFRDFNRAASTYQADSDINRFNSSEKGISDGNDFFLQLVKFSGEWHKKSEGFFDPTVAPLVDLWGFGTQQGSKAPSAEAVDSVFAFVGFERIGLEGNRVSKDNPNVQLNFNSITGYSNDLVAELFDGEGIQNYLIEIGGEVRVKGKSDKNALWKLGIDKPIEGQQQLFRKIQLANLSLATSGNYRKFIIDPETQEKITHSINPKTGKYQASTLISATVIHPQCGAADALATALMAMGDSAATAFATAQDFPVMLVFLNNEEDDFRVQEFNGFADLLLP